MAHLIPTRRIPMIIECEQCRSKFNLDEGLLKNGGTKVRCSQCHHVFRAFPPGAGSPAREELLKVDELDKTSTLETDLDFESDLGKELGEEIEIEEEIQTEEETAGLGLDEASTRRPAGGREEWGMEKAVEQAAVEQEIRPEREPGEAPKKKDTAHRPQKARAPGRSLFLPILLILILLLLGGSTAVYFLAPQLIPGVITDAVPFLKGFQKPEAKDPGVRRLSFKTITGSFVQSNKAGMLFLIKGMVANNYSNSRSFILIKGSILDDKGKVVKTKLAYAGNTFSESEIKEMTLDQITQALRNRSGKNDINQNVKPQAAVPFMVIFEELPENLSEFTVEAVSSAQGE
jgi:predicted Zn finger-like uncharacterized protein